MRDSVRHALRLEELAALVEAQAQVPGGDERQEDHGVSGTPLRQRPCRGGGKGGRHARRGHGPSGRLWPCSRLTPRTTFGCGGVTGRSRPTLYPDSSTLIVFGV